MNLLEFGFGTDAGTPDNATLNSDGSVNGTPTVQLTGGGGGVTFDAVFNRRDDAGQPGSVEYTVQFSGDLVTFYDSTAPVTIVTDSTADPAYHESTRSDRLRSCHLVRLTVIQERAQVLTYLRLRKPTGSMSTQN